MNLLQVVYVLTYKNDKGVICKTWILVDNCSTDSVRNK